jgi:hypothetical protein
VNGDPVRYVRPFDGGLLILSYLVCRCGRGFRPVIQVSCLVWFSEETLSRTGQARVSSASGASFRQFLHTKRGVRSIPSDREQSEPPNSTIMHSKRTVA